MPGGWELALPVSLTIVNATASKNAPASRFPKAKPYGWWIVVRNDTTHKLEALKRVSLAVAMETSHCLTFSAPAKGRATYSVHVLCDAVAGLDQVVDVPVSVAVVA